MHEKYRGIPEMTAGKCKTLSQRHLCPVGMSEECHNIDRRRAARAAKSRSRCTLWLFAPATRTAPQWNKNYRPVAILRLRTRAATRTSLRLLGGRTNGYHALNRQRKGWIRLVAASHPLRAVAHPKCDPFLMRQWSSAFLLRLSFRPALPKSRRCLDLAAASRRRRHCGHCGRHQSQPNYSK